MKLIAAQLTTLAPRISTRTIQLIGLIVTLSLLALGAGAPVGGGSGIPGCGG